MGALRTMVIEPKKETTCALGEPPALESKNQNPYTAMPPNEQMDSLKFCHACSGEGFVLVNEQVGKFSKMSRQMRMMCEQCEGEGMIDEKKKQREKEEKEARERREAESAKEPETPEHKIEVDQDIQVVEISTPHGTESVAETVARRIVAAIEMPLVSNTGDID